MFEMLISTGMRNSELSTVRCNMVDLDHIPIDNSTGEKSEYCGGSIHLDNSVVDVKNSRSRTVHFSRAAARMLKKYVEANMIDMSSDDLLMPTDLNYGLRTVGKAWFQMKFEEEMASMQSEDALLPGDIKDADDTTRQGKILGASNAAKAMIDPFKSRSMKISKVVDEMMKFKKKSKRNEGKFFKERMRTNEWGKRSVESLNPHSLRHFWAHLSYFRTIDGHERNMVHVSFLAGHKNMSTSLQYVTEKQIIKNMDEWEEIWIGNPSHWPACSGMPLPYEGNRRKAKEIIDNIRSLREREGA